MEKLLNIDSISPWMWYECQMPYHYTGAECPTIKMLLILETQINNIKQVSIVPPTVVVKPLVLTERHAFPFASIHLPSL